jgi:hypothetical protein
MKITNSIKNAEQALLDLIEKNLDWDNIKKIFKEKYQLKIKGDIGYESADITIYNDKVAYKLNFDVNMTVAIVCGRDGEFLNLLINEDLDRLKSINYSAKEDNKDSDFLKSDKKTYIMHGYEPREDILNTAAYIANMMTEINKG